MSPPRPSTEHASSDYDTEEENDSSHAGSTSNSAGTECETREPVSSHLNATTQSSEERVDVYSKENAVDGTNRLTSGPSHPTVGSALSSLRANSHPVAATRTPAQRTATHPSSDENEVPVFQFGKAPSTLLDMQGTRRSQASAGQVSYENDAGAANRAALEVGGKCKAYTPESSHHC